MADHPPKCDLDPKPIKTLIFDLMGTCLDWHSAVSPVLEKAFSLPEEERLPFTVTHWRSKCFEGMFDCYEAGQPQEDIDATRRRSLLTLLRAKGLSMDGDRLEACVQAWHSQIGKVVGWISAEGCLLMYHQRGRMWLQRCPCCDPSSMCKLFWV